MTPHPSPPVPALEPAVVPKEQNQKRKSYPPRRRSWDHVGVGEGNGAPAPRTSTTERAGTPLWTRPEGNDSRGETRRGQSRGKPASPALAALQVIRNCLTARREEIQRNGNNSLVILAQVPGTVLTIERDRLETLRQVGYRRAHNSGLRRGVGELVMHYERHPSAL